MLDAFTHILGAEAGGPIRTPPAAVAQALHLDAGTAATYILRLRTRDAQPLMVTEAWLPTRLAQGLTKRKLDR